MTHSDIYKKFLIEYDKDGITSSYPSLTDYEIATFLDKAYLALIAQKLTGNNQRGSGFESDSKSIEDIRPLIQSNSFTISKYKPLNEEDSERPLTPYGNIAKNEYCCVLPEYFLYYVQSYINDIPTALVSHQDASNFIQNDINYPWLKNPVCFVEGDLIHVLMDPKTTVTDNTLLKLTYIQKPNMFVDYYADNDGVDFECSDSMAEELINLAIVFATETVESQRATSKLNLRQLES